MTTEQKLEAYLDHERQERINEAMRKMLPDLHRQVDRDTPQKIMLPGDKFAKALAGEIDSCQ